jgi:hypothetical protein
VDPRLLVLTTQESIFDEEKHRRNNGKLFLTHGELNFPNAPDQPKTYLVGIFHSKSMFLLAGAQAKDVEYPQNVKGDTVEYINNLHRKVSEIIDNALQNKDEYKRIVILADANLGYIGNYFPTFLKDISLDNKNVKIILTSGSIDTVNLALSQLKRGDQNPGLSIIPKMSMTPPKLRELLINDVATLEQKVGPQHTG